MRNKIVYGLAGLLVLVLLIPIGAVIVNSFDVPLEPEVQRIVDTPIQCTEKQKAAYMFVLGVYGGAKDDQEKLGRELWEKREEPGFWSRFSNGKPWLTDFAGCPNGKCTVELLKDPKYQDVLVKYHDLIETYLKLMKYREGCTLFRGDRKVYFGGVSGMPFSPHRLLTLQMMDWAVKGEQDKVRAALIDSNHYVHSYYHTGNMLERTMAVVLQANNIEFVKEELARNPKFVLTPELLDSFFVPDVDTLAVESMEQELHVLDNFVHADIHMLDFEMPFGDDVILMKSLKKLVPARAFIRPNETLNKFYSLSREMLDAKCETGKLPEDCVSDLKWAKFSNPWRFIENPMGRLLTAMVMPNYLGRRNKLRIRREMMVTSLAEFRAKMTPAHSRKTK